jgi:large subunit ribosomal protein L1
MQKQGKRYRNLAAAYDLEQLFAPDEAIGLVKKNATAKFNETIEIHIRLGVDPKKSDQAVRGTVNLPHGTGRSVRVIAFARGEAAKAAEAAGADLVGEADLIEKVKAGFTDFDVAVATPDMMPSIGKELGRILAQKMPNPKSGTVTPNIGNAVKEIKSGKVEYRLDKTGIIHTIVGKASFDENQLTENVATLLDAVVRAKPAAAKGTYLRTITVTSTMGPGVKVDPTRVKATSSTSNS